MPVRTIRPGDMERELTARLETLGTRPAPRSRKRPRAGMRGRLALAASFGLLTLMLASVSGVFATHALGLFELDGDAVDGTSPAGSTQSLAGDDWSTIYTDFTNPDDPPTSGAEAIAFTTDKWDDTTDDIFTGGSTKDDLDTSGWLCKRGGAVDKNDIEHAFAAAYTKTIDGDDHTILYFGADKFSTSGDAQIGFWFFKNAVGCTPSGTGTGTQSFTGGHTIGDILLLSDFTNGGNVSKIRAYEWVGSGGDTNGTLNFVAEASDCDDPIADNDPLCANVNPVGNEATGGWTYAAKSNLVGTPPPKGTAGRYPKGAFYEGGIDLTEFFGGDVTCFSTFMAETRQSQSVDSVLEDFAIGNLSTCKPDLSLAKTPDGEIHFVGESFDWTITVTNSGDGDATDAVVTDTIPDGLTINGATTPNGTCDVTGQDVECTIDVAKDGGTATITVNVTATGDAVTDESGCSDLDNEATVTHADDDDTTDNTDSGQVTVCALSVEKTAATTFDRDYDWTIDKSVDPATAALFDGQTADFDYTVNVTKSAPVDSNWAVSGTITITNPADIAASISSITDTISGGFGEVSVDCGGATSVPANDSLACTYSTSLPNGDTRTNSVDVVAYGTTYNGTAAITWGDPTNVSDNSDSVDDTIDDGDFGPFSSSTSNQYTETYDCSGVEYTDGVGTKEIPNTATLVDDGDSAGASVTITCYQLGVEKTAETTYDRDYDWTIEKSAADESVLLAAGQSYFENYTVTVTPSAAQDSGFAVSGTITITNPAPMAADITSIVDTISGGVGTVSVDCGGATSVAANDSLECTYSSGLSDATALTNSVDVVAYGVTYNATAAITFGEPADVTDECVDVNDTLGGALGTVCVGDPAADFSFEYSYDIGQEFCGEYDIENTADFTTNDNAETGTASDSVHVSIPCPTGCTLTQGYWKTHSENGPAPEDEAWLDLPDMDGDGIQEGPGETFYLSGVTWYQVFWTAPKGNVYYNLAHQYMAAVLNGVNDADTTVVDTAIAQAETLFEAYTPGQIASLKGKKAPRPEFVSLAGTLASYNEGTIGPGHCDEDSFSQL